MIKSGYLTVFFLFMMGILCAQTNLIQNPGFENTPSSFTVNDGTNNQLMRITTYTATTTAIANPTLPAAVNISDGLWVKKQSVNSSVTNCYLAAGGANSSASFLFMKVGGGSSTQGIDWTQFSAQQRVQLSNSKTYSFSFWAKVGTGVSTAYAYIADKSGNTGGSSFYKAIPLTGGSTWTKYTASFDIPAVRILNSSLDYTTAYVGVGVTPGYTTASPPLTVNTWLYVDDFELVETAQSVVPTISSVTSATTYIKTNPIPVTITFNAAVTGFTGSDLVVTNGSVNNFIAVSATTYTADIIPVATGKVTVDIAAGAAFDVNSNPSVAATQFVRLFNNEVTTGNYSSITTICPVKDNKKAVYTFTGDDGFTDAASFYNNEFKRLNLCGSLALVANWINGTQTPASTYPFWNSILADGRIDIINHSKSHVKFSTISNLVSGKDSLNNEIIGNQTVFRTKFPGQDIITMANPSVVNTDAADVLIKQSHYAARNGGSGYNPLSPTDTEWYRLNMYATYMGSLSRAAYSSEINKYVDNTIANKQWLIILAHGIGTAVNAMPDTAFTRHFEYVATKTNDLWVGTLGDVTRYFREKQNASVLTVDSTASQIAISVTHTLDAQIFKFPLTLKTKIPANWTNVTVSQNSVSQNVNSVLESGLKYIYYDAIPNGGTVVLKPSSISTLNQIDIDSEKPAFIYKSATSELVLYNLQAESTVRLCNLAGVEFRNIKINQQNTIINMSGLKKGLYIASWMSENGFSDSTKIVIK